MATTTDSTATDPAFVVERFATSGDRLEVAGHWRGLRGRRFVRPVLWLHHGEHRRRLVAVLDHKPWAADDGEPWLAAFKWEGGKLDAERAELEVGNELVVELPLPGRASAKPRPARARIPTELEVAREQLLSATKERGELTAALQVAQSQADQLARVRAERDSAREEADRARADGERMANDEYRQRERAQAAADEAVAARELAERQLAAAREAYADLESQREDAVAARDAVAAERDRLAAEREALIGARDDAVAARNALAASRGDTSERDALVSHVKELTDRVAQVERERDRVIAERDALAASATPSAEPSEMLEREQERLEAEVASPARRGPAGAHESRLATPRAGVALWGVRVVALVLVAILLAAVAILVANLI